MNFFEFVKFCIETYFLRFIKMQTLEKIKMTFWVLCDAFNFQFFYWQIIIFNFTCKILTVLFASPQRIIISFLLLSFTDIIILLNFF